MPTLPDHVLTTSPKSFGKNGRQWLRLTNDRELRAGLWHVFTDGSSLGSRAAVVVSPDGEVTRHSEWEPPTKTRNIGTEWEGLLLGLRAAPHGVRLVIVVDLLWVHAQLVGCRRTLEPETKIQLAEAKRLVDYKRLDLVLIHHEGHQEDDSAFTRWNVEADRLCTEKALSIRENTPCVGDVVEVKSSDGGALEREVTKVSLDSFLAKSKDGTEGAWRLSHHGSLWKLAECKSLAPKKPKKSTAVASASSRSSVKKTRTKRNA